MTNQATRIIVKAAGELAADGSQAAAADDETDDGIADETEEVAKEALQPEDQEQRIDAVDIETYVPAINEKREWVLSELSRERQLPTRLDHRGENTVPCVWP